MNLIIKNENNLELNDFLLWLKDKIKSYLIAQIELKKLIAFDEYINTGNIIRYVYEPRFISTYDILVGGAANLIIKKINDQYEIEIDPNINIPGTFIKYIDIIKLVNRGNLSLVSYPIYDDVMQYFADNIELYYKQYIEE